MAHFVLRRLELVDHDPDAVEAFQLPAFHQRGPAGLHVRPDRSQAVRHLDAQHVVRRT